MAIASKISVIIPCFNYGRFLKNSLSSVVAQTLAPVETLVIDDGSTDPETLAVLQGLSADEAKVVRQENRGLSGARNTGLRRAAGDYVYFLDADDIMFPDCLEKLAALLDASPDAVAACSGVRLLGGERHGTDWLPHYDPYTILVRNLWAAGIMLRRDEVVRRSFWYDEAMRHGYEDWEFNIRLTRTGLPVKVFPGALYHYRIHRASMLISSRSRHAEIVGYIRAKHKDAYKTEALLDLKKRHAPAVAIEGSSADGIRLAGWAATQTFQDWSVWKEAGIHPIANYHLLHDGASALERLPPEALETAVMSLESNSLPACILAVKLDTSPLSVGSAWREGRCQPVAVLLRARSFSKLPNVQDLLARGECILRFADRGPGAASGWEPMLLSSVSRQWSFRDVVALRKRLSALGEKVFGLTLKSYCVKLYDLFYYKLLFSDRAVQLRKKLQPVIGAGAENALARIVYGLFLAKPPEADEYLRPFSAHDYSAPLFLRLDNKKKLKLLIATAWLNQGGVEQEILDLCRHLDRSRFDVTIATTKRSAHPWENLARQTGAAVYHLADSLEVPAISRGLAHLIVNRRIDVLQIVHSKEAYEALGLIKRLCPYVAISDRNVTLGSGFAKVSAKIGAGNIDLRTAGHQALARSMSKSYGLDRESLRVVYAGTDLRRADAALGSGRGRLHALCGIAPDIPIVLFLGRLDPEKRPQVFVRTAAEILKLRPDCRAHFVLVGDGESRARVEALVNKLGLQGRVHLLGFRLDGFDLLCDSAVMMIPSAYEGLALVSFEAMALGVPQVSADVGGQSELITPETGVLVRNGRGEVARYTRACIDLLSDPERRERMADAAKQRIRTGFTVDCAAEEYGRIFEELAGLSRDRAANAIYLKPPHVDPLRAFG
jgi:glycosyltransferase involved in cell wall biosynthesis